MQKIWASNIQILDSHHFLIRYKNEPLTYLNQALFKICTPSPHLWNLNFIGFKTDHVKCQLIIMKVERKNDKISTKLLPSTQEIKFEDYNNNLNGWFCKILLLYSFTVDMNFVGRSPCFKTSSYCENILFSLRLR